MFRKSRLNPEQSRRKKGVRLWKKLLKKLCSIHFCTFVILFLFSIIPVYAIDGLIHYYYREAVIEDKIAALQTKSAVIAGEFSDYTSLAEAEKAGLYQQMVKYSSLELMRIRIVNNDFVIKTDSYSFETGKTIINTRVINAFNARKSYSGYDSQTGTIEAVTPIYNNSNELIGVFVAGVDISEVNKFQRDIVNLTDVVKIALIVFMLAFSYFVSVTMFKSIKKEMRKIDEIANGHKGICLKEKGYTEYRKFAKKFNMIMDKAGALDQNRQEFVSNVSHELKTPITSIKVLADSLNIQEDVPVELYKEFMQDIAKEIDRESKIIDDLLSLVRMDKSAEALNIASVNVNELVEIVLKRLKPIAQKKNIELLFESFRPVVAEIDEVKFTQVVSNLVENAIKYNNIDGWVHVSLNADYQYFYVRVEDSGIGIPKESEDMVFERFYRVDKARSRETGGTGLGLSIVKNIILMHHGTIKMHSEEGVGTTFTVRIPLNYVSQKDLKEV